jgi:hypothetical protein
VRLARLLRDSGRGDEAMLADIYASGRIKQIGRVEFLWVMLR